MTQLPPAAEAAFETAQEMMQSIVAIKGQPYAFTVEVAINMIKCRDIVGALLNEMVDAEMLDLAQAEKLFDVMNMISARNIGLTRMCWDKDSATQEQADEIMGWAERLREYEDRGTEAIVKSLGEDE